MNQFSNNKIQNKNPFSIMEEEVLDFWNKSKIFQKSLKKESPKGNYVFYDGPPFITGLPHYATLLPSIAKDLVPRYWTMKGYHVERVWGWDCHGLPAENKVEQELGLKNKKDIEKLGVEKFTQACRSYVDNCSTQWKWYIDRIGRWVDMDNAYKTMDLNFMESVLWSFKELYNKNLIYEGYRSSLHCPRCATPLSKFEITMDAGSYKDVTEKSVVVKFKLTNQKHKFLRLKPQEPDLKINRSVIHLLAWTTTPWTLPGNMALAVGKDIDYVLTRIITNKINTNDYEYYILAKNRVDEILKNKEYKIIQEFKGEELVGLNYEPIFDLDIKEIKNNKNTFKIYSANFVSTEEGTGIVHIAPNFGEDDFNLGKKNNLPVVELMNENGCYNKEMGQFSNLYFKKANKIALENLENNDLIFSNFSTTHSYPFCYRCNSPLIYKTQKAWYLKISKMREQLLESNKKINWIPEHFKYGRFQYNLESAPDWCISRSRYWATPLPVWRCKKCKHQEVIGSINELKNKIPDKISKIILIRHGEAINNAEKVFDSSTDNGSINLTKNGIKQVKEVAKELKKIKEPMVIYSSPVFRTKQTAKIIAKELNVEIKKDYCLKEIDNGHWDNKHADDDSIQESRKKYKLLSCEEQYTAKRGKIGESWEYVENRIYQGVKKIIQKEKNKTIILITHQASIIYFLKAIKNLSLRQAVLLFNKPIFQKYAQLVETYINNTTFKELDFHKHTADKIEFQCEKCGGTMKRVLEVLDCWFESGSVPYAQFHYPFQKKHEFKNIFPADFIVEYTGQLRGWFYYLHVLSNCLFNSTAFKNVIVTGVLTGTDGRKMSKSYGNYPDSKMVLEKYGSDALRMYFMASPIMLGGDMSFSEQDIQIALRKNVILVWNVVKFFELFADETQIVTNNNTNSHESDNVLDKWILIRLDQLIKIVTENLDKYNLPQATKIITDFIDDLSTWYLRRSRDRFKSDNEKDKQAALQTTNYVLIQLSKIIAPFMPFIAEQIWQKITCYNFKHENKSVHLEAWPISDVGCRMSDVGNILKNMKFVRKIVELGLAKRDEAGIKVRQPLDQFSIFNFQFSILDKEYLNLIKDELNVKKVKFVEGESGGELRVELDIKLTPELIQEGMKRELARLINSMRKNAGLTIQDRIVVYWESESEDIKKMINKYKKELLKDVLADKIVSGIDNAVDIVKEMQMNENKIILGIKLAF